MSFLYVFTILLGFGTADTVDNWQIRYGDHLVIAGNLSFCKQSEPIRLKKLPAQDLSITYNTCVPYTRRPALIRLVSAENDRIFFSREVSVNTGEPVVIPARELEEINFRKEVVNIEFIWTDVRRHYNVLGAVMID